MIVTRISQSGFYATDLNDTPGRLYLGVYAFNFSAPPGMRVCDRLKTFTGTASEFFGFTQLGYPTWTLEEWDPQQRPCLVPEPTVLGPADVIADTNGDGQPDTPATLLPRTGSLMRVLTSPQDKVTVKITSKFGPDLVKQDRQQELAALGDCLELRPQRRQEHRFLEREPRSGVQHDLHRRPRLHRVFERRCAEHVPDLGLRRQHERQDPSGRDRGADVRSPPLSRPRPSNRSPES